VDVDSIDLLVIPGGDPSRLVGNQEFKDFIEKLVARNKKVAGICGGAEMLAGMGLLKGKRCTGGTSGEKPGTEGYRYFAESILSDEHVVVDGNFITAQGRAYVEFAVELARQMGLVTSEEAYADGLRYFKNIRQ
jgi:putative intracellular protease/amidase